MIDNSDSIGNYYVTVFAAHNRIASFQCSSLDNCYIEVDRISHERSEKGLTTTRATARRLKGKSGRLRLFDDPFEIQIAV